MQRLPLLLALPLILACAAPRTSGTEQSASPSVAQTPVPGDTSLARRLVAAERRWARWEPATYDLDIEQSCFCAPRAVRGILTVRGDSIISMRDTLGAPLAEGAARRVRYSVRSLFKLLDTRVADTVSWSVSAEFDRTAGYPTSVHMENRRVSDIGGSYVIRSVRARQ